MSYRKKVILAFVVGTIFVISAGASYRSFNTPPDYVKSIRRNTIIFGELLKQVSYKYVEEIDPEKLMRIGINAMLGATDPYSILIEKEDDFQFRIITQGKYGGVGMLVGIKGDWPTVVEPPYEGTPAMKAGIREGDKITEIDGVPTKGKTISEVASYLRGEKGTEVTINIFREGNVDQIEFRLIRGDIVIKDVSYAGMLENNIGYIKLSRFSKNASSEVKNAVIKLKKEGMKGLVFDVRSNPGGLLQAAIGVADIFLKKGEKIVETRGRLEEMAQTYYSTNKPALGDLPLVVLIDSYSASASEIVSGAVQDLDRGIIIGRQSFGKGLVQSVVGITPNANLKLTTAKYYLPSGRLIQKEQYSRELLFQDSSSTASANVLSGKYTTRSGRKVYANGGIVPDIHIETDTLSLFERALLRQSMTFNYAVIYANTHPDLQRGFEITDSIIEEFAAFIKSKDFSYQTEADAKLAQFRKSAKTQGLFAAIKPQIESIEKQLDLAKEDDFAKSRDFIKKQIAMEISAKLWDTKAKIESNIKEDKDLIKALEIIANKEEYQSLVGQQ